MIPAASKPLPPLPVGAVNLVERVYILKKYTERRAYYFTGVMRVIEMETGNGGRIDRMVADTGFLPGDAYRFASLATALDYAALLNVWGSGAPVGWVVIDVDLNQLDEEAL